jgi:hypothetical protein
VFSGSRGYSDIKHLIFFHNQKILLIRCQLYKEAGQKAHRQDEHFLTIDIKSTINRGGKRRLETRILGGGGGSESKLFQDLVRETARKPHDQQASSYGLSYVNTLLAKHEIDERLRTTEIKSTI